LVSSANDRGDSSRKGFAAFKQLRHVEVVRPTLENAGEGGVEHRLERGAELKVVRRGDQVQRAPHHRRLDDDLVLDEPGDLLPAEALNAGPQPDERRHGGLRLQADEPGDRLCCRAGVPGQKHLAGQEGPVELPQGQDPVGHGINLLRQSEGGAERLASRSSIDPFDPDALGTQHRRDRVVVLLPDQNELGLLAVNRVDVEVAAIR
jgi:hypothetical protein